MALDKKTVVIIGGSSGFGKEVARSVGEKGANLIITGRDVNKLEKAVSELREQGCNVSGLYFDAAKPEAMASFFENLPAFDHLVSMVGGAMGGGFLDASFDTIRHAVEEKFFHSLAIAKAAGPYVKESGSFVFTSGAGGRPDGASGAIVGNQAISTLVRGLAVELAPKARVNAVAPTWTPTPLWRNLGSGDVETTQRYFEGVIPLGRVARVSEVAEAYVFLMQCGFITGQTITVDGGLSLLG